MDTRIRVDPRSALAASGAPSGKLVRDKVAYDPASGLLILNRLGIPASHAVMVGDTTHDLHMAHAAGMRSVAVSYGVHDPARLRSAEPTWLHDNFPAVVETLMTIRDTTCATFEER